MTEYKTTFPLEHKLNECSGEFESEFNEISLDDENYRYLHAGPMSVMYSKMLLWTFRENRPKWAKSTLHDDEWRDQVKANQSKYDFAVITAWGSEKASAYKFDYIGSDEDYRRFLNCWPVRRSNPENDSQRRENDKYEWMMNPVPCFDLFEGELLDAPTPGFIYLQKPTTKCDLFNKDYLYNPESTVYIEDELIEVNKFPICITLHFATTDCDFTDKMVTLQKKSDNDDPQWMIGDYSLSPYNQGFELDEDFIQNECIPHPRAITDKFKSFLKTVTDCVPHRTAIEYIFFYFHDLPRAYNRLEKQNPVLFCDCIDTTKEW